MQDRRSLAQDVTVIVPTFNRARYIRESLDSILNQTVKPGRIMVIDDGSTDDTRSIVDSYGETIEYVWKENGGKAVALNQALRAIEKGFIWAFDDDDVAESDALEKLYQGMIDHPDCGFAYGAYDNFLQDENLKMETYGGDVPDVSSEQLFPALMERCFIFQGGMLVRRSCYDEVGYFDEQLIRSQDYDMLLRLSRRFKSVRVEGIVFHMRQHHGVRGTALNAIHSHNMEDTWRKYDNLIMNKLLNVLSLEDYLPHGTILETMEDQSVLANLQKFVIFGRKDMWISAAAALNDYVSAANALGRTSLTADETAKFGRVLDNYSRGLHSLGGHPEIEKTLRRLRSRSLQRQVRRALAAPLSYVLRLSFRRRRADTTRKTFAALIVLLGPIKAAHIVVGVACGILVARMTGDSDGALNRFKTRDLATRSP